MLQGRIGKYEIQTELGIGGFGRVYRAYDPSVGRPVAIKVLSSVGDPDLLTRFRAEAGMTGKLQHKNIVTVFDCGEQDGSPYIVMELLEGENLQTLLNEKKPLTLLEKMRIMCQVAEGLYYAHQSGVIHRDVKPANIMLLPSGLVKMMDFGIARLVHMGASRQTRSGDLIGTTSYMAPDQFAGADADAKTDIFAYGVIYYELLSGVHPFNAADVSAQIYRIMSVEPPRLRDIVPDCPEALEDLVHRALAKDRSRRYSSLDDILIDAEPIMLDLRREQAVAIMIEVKALIAQGDFDSANTRLKQAIELDPANRDARRVRETLQEERNRHLLEESIQAMERDAAAKTAKRQFVDALQTIEGALRLKPDDERLIGLVEESRGRMLASREAARLLAAAKGEAQSNKLEEAKALALQALAADPQHPEAPPLIKHLDDEIERIENAKRLKAGIEEAERLLAEADYDGAIASLQALETAFPGSLQIGELQNRVIARQTEDYRRKRLARLELELAKAHRLQNAGLNSDALSVLEALSPDYPDISAIENLRSAIQEEISAQARAAAITELADTARTLLWSRQLDEAIPTLERGLEQFPGDAGLERLLDVAKALELDAARQQSLSELRENASALRKQNRLEDALELLKNGLRTHGHDTVLSDICRVLVLELEDRRSAERLQRYCANATELLAAGSPSEALSVLREARTHYPTDPSLELLLAQAEESFAKQSEQEIVASILKSSTALEKNGDATGALEEITKGLRRLPAAKDLLLAASNLRGRIQLLEREKRVQSAVAEIATALAASNWAGAASNIASAQREFPDQIVFDELATQLQIKQRSAEVDKAVAVVREHLNSGNLGWAAVALAQLEPAYGDDDLWKAEKRNLERKQAYLDNLRRAEELRNNGQYEDAEVLLERLFEEDPSNAQAASLLRFVTAELIAQRPEEVLRRKREEAEQLIREGNRAAAFGALTRLAQQFPEDRAVMILLERVRAELSPTPAASEGDATRGRRRVRFAESVSAPPPPAVPTPAVNEPAPGRVCSKCGTRLPQLARFCDSCGSPVR